MAQQQLNRGNFYGSRIHKASAPTRRDFDNDAPAQADAKPFDLTSHGRSSAQATTWPPAPAPPATAATETAATETATAATSAAAAVPQDSAEELAEQRDAPVLPARHPVDEATANAAAGLQSLASVSGRQQSLFDDQEQDDEDEDAIHAFERLYADIERRVAEAPAGERPIKELFCFRSGCACRRSESSCFSSDGSYGVAGPRCTACGHGGRFHLLVTARVWLVWAKRIEICLVVCCPCREFRPIGDFAASEDELCTECQHPYEAHGALPVAKEKIVKDELDFEHQCLVPTCTCTCANNVVPRVVYRTKDLDQVACQACTHLRSAHEEPDLPLPPYYAELNSQLVLACRRMCRHTSDLDEPSVPMPELASDSEDNDEGKAPGAASRPAVYSCVSCLGFLPDKDFEEKIWQQGIAAPLRHSDSNEDSHELEYLDEEDAYRLVLGAPCARCSHALADHYALDNSVRPAIAARQLTLARQRESALPVSRLSLLLATPLSTFVTLPLPVCLDLDLNMFALGFGRAYSRRHATAYEPELQLVGCALAATLENLAQLDTRFEHELECDINLGGRLTRPIAWHISGASDALNERCASKMYTASVVLPVDEAQVDEAVLLLGIENYVHIFKLADLVERRQATAAAAVAAAAAPLAAAEDNTVAIKPVAMWYLILASSAEAPPSCVGLTLADESLGCFIQGLSNGSVSFWRHSCLLRPSEHARADLSKQAKNAFRTTVQVLTGLDDARLLSIASTELANHSLTACVLSTGVVRLLLVSGSKDEPVTNWRVQPVEEAWSHTCRYGAPVCAAWAPQAPDSDGLALTLAVGTQADSVLIFDLLLIEPDASDASNVESVCLATRELFGHRSYVSALAWITPLREHTASHCFYLASGSLDSTVLVWRHVPHADNGETKPIAALHSDQSTGPVTHLGLVGSFLTTCRRESVYGDSEVEVLFQRLPTKLMARSKRPVLDVDGGEDSEQDATD